MKSTFALLTLAAVVPATASAQTSVTIAETSPVVSLSVTENVESTPDLATIGTGVQTRAMTAEQAMRDNAAKMDSLIAALTKSGIAKNDVQTSRINLNAQYDYSNQNGQASEPRFIGYEATNQLTVRVRDIKKVGPLLDTLVKAGATNINGPSFGLNNDAAAQTQARTQALRSAKAQADFYAQAAGYRTTRLISISDSSSGGYTPAPMMAAARFKDSATPVEPGQVSTSVTLNVQYALEK